MSGRTWLVRHGRPLIDRALPAQAWPLDPAYVDDVRALAWRLPAQARWFSSPEVKALATARLLTAGPVAVVDDLREHDRSTGGWVEDFTGAVRRAFDLPDRPAVPGWEPLADCRDRVVAAHERLRAGHRGDHLVLVGHGTAWTVLAAALRGAPPDLDAWERLDLPDLVVV